MAVGNVCLSLASGIGLRVLPGSCLALLALVILLGLHSGGAVDSVVPGGSRARDGGLTRCNLQT
jgi:hypothetical protein